MFPTVYDVVMERLQAHERKPYAIRLTTKQWRELRQDRRCTARDLHMAPGDPPMFLGVPVRIDSKLKAGRGFQPQVFATADELHEALHG